ALNALTELPELFSESGDGLVEARSLACQPIRGGHQRRFFFGRGGDLRRQLFAPLAPLLASLLVCANAVAELRLSALALDVLGLLLLHFLGARGDARFFLGGGRETRSQAFRPMEVPRAELGDPLFAAGQLLAEIGEARRRLLAVARQALDLLLGLGLLAGEH